jgi:hypothetical protein
MALSFLAIGDQKEPLSLEDRENPFWNNPEKGVFTIDHLGLRLKS